MTDEPIHKAVFRYSELALFRNRGTAVGLFQRIQDWLEENGRKDHYIMSYLNGADDEADIGELIVVLNDKDTALLLKLAVT